MMMLGNSLGDDYGGGDFIMTEAYKEDDVVRDFIEDDD